MKYDNLNNIRNISISVIAHFVVYEKSTQKEEGNKRITDGY